MLLPYRIAPTRNEGLFAYVLHDRIIRGNLFPLTVGRTLAFHQLHNGMVDRSKWVRVFEGEDAVKKGKGRKCFVSEI